MPGLLHTVERTVNPGRLHFDSGSIAIYFNVSYEQYKQKRKAHNLSGMVSDLSRNQLNIFSLDFLVLVTVAVSTWLALCARWMKCVYARVHWKFICIGWNRDISADS
jgi:hypothetical protein